MAVEDPKEVPTSPVRRNRMYWMGMPAKLMLKCISMAGQGNVAALRLCMERILPARREALFQLNLPKIRTTQDVNKAAEKVTQAMARGRMTASDGEKVMSILEMRFRIIDSAELESRLARLETQASK
jgi:hypothetical protein